MIFDGVFALAGDDDDVFDAGGHALFGDVLNLGLVDDGEHFFGLRFGGGEEASAEAGSGKDSFSDAAAGGGSGSGVICVLVLSLKGHKRVRRHTFSKNLGL